MSSAIALLAGIGMACGPPLIYADQAYNIVKMRDSSGFSHDVCGVIMIANITRCFFFLGHRFELPLLFQSILLIISQLFLLAICLHYRPPPSSTPSQAPPSMFAKRPWDFWQWKAFGAYVEFLAAMIVVLGVAQLIFGRWSWYVESLGYIALGIESTLPIPQFFANYQRKSTYGFRDSTLAGWFCGDVFKTGYFLLKGSPAQFIVTALMTVAWDTAVLIQRIKYGSKPPYSQAMDYEHEDGMGPMGRISEEDEETGDGVVLLRREER